ncbi:unnamed protein product, partial [Staurois parvus]
GHFLASSFCSPHHHTVPRAPVPPSHNCCQISYCCLYGLSLKLLTLRHSAMGLLGIQKAAQRVRAISSPVRRLFRLMDGSTMVYDLLRTHGITS